MQRLLSFSRVFEYIVTLIFKRTEFCEKLILREQKYTFNYIYMSNG